MVPTRPRQGCTLQQQQQQQTTRNRREQRRKAYAGTRGPVAVLAVERVARTVCQDGVVRRRETKNTLDSAYGMEQQCDLTAPPSRNERNDDISLGCWAPKSTYTASSLLTLGEATLASVEQEGFPLLSPNTSHPRFRTREGAEQTIPFVLDELLHQDVVSYLHFLLDDTDNNTQTYSGV